MNQSRTFLQSSTTLIVRGVLSCSVRVEEAADTFRSDTTYSRCSSQLTIILLTGSLTFCRLKLKYTGALWSPSPFPGTLVTHRYFTQRSMPHFLPSARLCFHFCFPRLSAVPALEFLSLDILGNGGQGSFVEGLTYALQDDWSAHGSTHWMQGNSPLFV